MKVELRDRHSEHLDSIELCDHGDVELYIGDKLTMDAFMGGEVIAQFELEWVDKKRMRVTLNQLDYLIAQRVQKLSSHPSSASDRDTE